MRLITIRVSDSDKYDYTVAAAQQRRWRAWRCPVGITVVTLLTHRGPGAGQHRGLGYLFGRTTFTYNGRFVNETKPDSALSKTLIVQPMPDGHVGPEIGEVS